MVLFIFHFLCYIVFTLVEAVIIVVKIAFIDAVFKWNSKKYLEYLDDITRIL